MNRFKMEPVGEGYWIIDDKRDEGAEHPVASTGCAAYAKRIMDALNAVHDLDDGLLAVGQVYRKCGILRAIVRLTDDYVWYESPPEGPGNSRVPACRTARSRFEDWVHGAKIVRVDHPARFAGVDAW